MEVRVVEKESDSIYVVDESTCRYIINKDKVKEFLNWEDIKNGTQLKLEYEAIQETSPAKFYQIHSIQII